MRTWLKEPEALPIVESPNEPLLRITLQGLRSDGKLVRMVKDIDPPIGKRDEVLAQLGFKLTNMRESMEKYLDENCKCTLPKKYQKEPCVIHGEEWIS